MATKANSISIAKLAAAAHDAAKTALTKANLGHIQVDPGIIVDHQWIIGIILRNPDLTHVAQYQQIAEQVTTQLSKVALNPQPLPPKASASLYIHDHIIICGYRPIEALPIAVE